MKADGDSKNLKLAVGGFSQGCATSLYIMACSVIGKYSNGKPFPIKFDAAIGLSGWMPTIKYVVQIDHHLCHLQKGVKCSVGVAASCTYQELAHLHWA